MNANANKIHHTVWFCSLVTARHLKLIVVGKLIREPAVSNEIENEIRKLSHNVAADAFLFIETFSDE